jgi:2-dehydro-3-deoxyphosphogluconate aldolase / (4S)-4-hydroxy-2-oxoglutarate aldolase
MSPSASPREAALAAIRGPGVLPALKLKRPLTADEAVILGRAIVGGGCRILEITMTSPGVLDAFRAIRAALGDEIALAAGTTLDAAAARDAIDAGATAIVSPAVIPDVIATARRYGVASLAGAYSATEVLHAMTAGSDMVKVFPAALAGPRYMTNLRMVYPNVELVPSGGIDLTSAGAYIEAGATAVSGARSFVDPTAFERSPMSVSEQLRAFVAAVAEARTHRPDLP